MWSLPIVNNEGGDFFCWGKVELAIVHHAQLDARKVLRNVLKREGVLTFHSC